MRITTFSSRYKLPLLILLAAAICLPSACSALKISYNNAPDLLYWWLDGYVDFSAKQKPLAKQELRQLQQWHRHHELPKYAALVQQVSATMQSDISPKQACEVLDTAKKHIEQLNQQVAPIILAISQDLSDQQLVHIANKFADQNEKWREKWMDNNPKKREKKRLEDAIDRAESFYSNLNQVQEDLLLESIRNSSFKPEISDQRRQQNQQNLLSILRNIEQGELKGAQAKQEIQNFMHQMTDPEDQEYQAYIEKLTLESCQTIANLHNTTTAKQRKNLQNNLSGYREDMNALIALADQ